MKAERIAARSSMRSRSCILRDPGLLSTVSSISRISARALRAGLRCAFERHQLERLEFGFKMEDFRRATVSGILQALSCGRRALIL
jgi:hypothetical protein